MIGKTLAHYHVIAKLGEGGMGVVYRATDTRLGRDVAIKVLPAAVASDPERLARFEREARTLASLNHPNIAAVYGVEQGALVMELVEGQTLAERIQAGAIPLDEALPIVRQIADALEAAHEKGIIHRDLKPANVKITPDGVVKLLDFGLAKAMEADSASSDPENSPTLTIGSSRTGVIMGTAGYMSPEQARGGKVDRRTDIWAYGVVLYEMVAGRTLFKGETVSDTLAAVLTREPDLSVVPTRIRPLLRRCLQRDAKKRLGWIGEACTALDQPPPETSAPPRRGWIIPALAAVALLSLGLVVALLLRAPKQEEIPVRRFAINAPSLLSLPYVRSVAISPNGKRVAYVAASKLWVRELDQEDARPLEGTDVPEGPFWSPDSAFLGYSSRSQLWKVSATGGIPVPLCRTSGSMFFGGAWSIDGKTIVYSYNGARSLMSVSAAGGEPRMIGPALEAGWNFYSPQYLPGDAGPDWILACAGNGLAQRMLMINLQTGERQELGPGNYATYSSSGHIIFGRGSPQFEDGFWAAPFSVRARKTTGEAFLVSAEGVHPTVARDGALIYTFSGSRMAQMVIRDRDGKQLGRVGVPQPVINHLAVSPDGRRVAISSAAKTSTDIWIYDLGSSLRNRLTFGPGTALSPKWSPDGKQIVFQRNRDVFVQAADGTGEPALLTAGPTLKTPGDWSADGKYIVYTAGGDDIFYLKRKQDGGGYESAPFATQPQFLENSPRLSPNGQYLAYISDESGRTELFVRPFPEGSGRWQVSTNGAIQPRWSRDGKELFYLQGDVLMAVDVSTQGTFSSGSAKRLFATGNFQIEYRQLKYDTLPNGRFLVLEPAGEEGEKAGSIHVVQNWLAASREQGAQQ